ncbi:MAG: DUF5317 domain-containing protein [Chloroflexi bacterium]|nr:DUF5317 domain-containing protein [Chloroflexota bacterium]
MILLAAAVVGVLVGWMRGGRWQALADVPFRWGGWALAALAAQLLVVRAVGPEGQGLRWAVMAAAYTLLLAVAWRNCRLPGVWMVGLGLLLNGAVILANGGAMPITPEMAQQIGVPADVVGRVAGALAAGAKDIILPQEQTALWILSDILRLPLGGRVAFSVGDVWLALGVVRLVERSMSGRLPSRRAEAPAN